MACGRPRVGIIGAGVAGAAAASLLWEAGVTDLLLLEAADRTGGRVHTHYDRDSPDDPYKIELGANWIHGRKGNPVFDLAKKYGLLKQIPFKNKTAKDGRGLISFVTHGTQKVSADLRHNVSKKYYDTLDWINTFHTEGLPSEYHTNISVMDVVEEKVRAFIETLDESEKSFAHGILNHLLICETSISGCDSMADVSAAAFGSYEELDEGEPLVRQGYSKVVDVLLKDIPPSKILLTHAVTQVNWKYNEKLNRCTQQENTSTESSSQAVNVVCDNGTQFTFDCVITTTSLGHLKKVQAHMFRPPLPEPKQHAIQRMGIGTSDKIFLEYDNLEFLPKHAYRMRFSKSEEDLRCDGGTKDTWFKKIPSFDVVDKPKTNMIYCWVSGRAGEVMETLTDDEVINGCHTVLSDYFGIKDIPRPIRLIRTSWGTNPLTLGSYSYIAVGSSIADVDMLAAPLMRGEKPRLLFAGEATHKQFYSTVHGALLSGQREAQSICDAWNIQQLHHL